MSPSQQIPEEILPVLISDSEQHEHDATVQNASVGESAAEFTHISPMIESLDELLAGEGEIPTTKHEPYDDQFSVQAYPTPEVDPAAAENARLEYEKYLDELHENPAPAPRIERVNEPDYFIGRGVITGTSYPVTKTPPEALRRQPRNGPLQNSFVPDYNANKTIWETREERLNAIDHQNAILNPRSRLSEYFVWGISYNPPNELSQGHRAVHIDAPMGSSLKSILDNINTGQIFSATLCNTAAITGRLTALIVFVAESGASQLKSNLTSKSLNPTHITSHPTWPISATMLKQIRQGWTRCLSIRGLPSAFSTQDAFDMILQPRYSQAKEVLDVQRDALGCFHVEFSSIAAADKVFGLIRAHYRGSDVVVSFAADPCSSGLPVSFGVTPDGSPATLTPASSFGSQGSESMDDKASLVAKYGQPPVFGLAGALPETQNQSIMGSTQPSNSVGNKDAPRPSSTIVDAKQFMAAAALMQVHGEDASLAAAQQTTGDPEPARDFFEYHGSSLNWADEMIDEAAEEGYSNAPALDILVQQALGGEVY